MSNFSKKRLTIMGSGVSGTALAKMAVSLGHAVFVTDKREIAPLVLKEYRSLGIDYECEHTERLFQADEIIISSGICPHTPELIEATQRGIRLVGELDFVYPYLNGKIIAITGSNGKTTTTALVGHLLQSVGGKTVIAGNIGYPLADVAQNNWDYIVLELSSFQLHWSHQYQVDFSMITNLAPDHIDWHGSYEAYEASKISLIERTAQEGAIIVQQRDFDKIPKATPLVYALEWSQGEKPGSISISAQNKAARIHFAERSELLFDFGALSLLGKHNIENAAMASAVLNLLGYPNSLYRDGLRLFSPPPHRCQLVAEHQGVRFIDDSKGTNVAACITALRALDGRKIVLLGGRGKGEAYQPLVDTLKKEHSLAVLMGEEKEKIADCFLKNHYDSFSLVADMQEAVATAIKLARFGDTVLLSPACTSWDVYPNYMARGEHFQKIVKESIL